MYFRLYASSTQIAKGETVSLAGLYAMRYSVLVLVDTTVPLARLQPHPTTTEPGKHVGAGGGESSSSEEDSNEEGQESAQGTDFDSLGPVSSFYYVLLTWSGGSTCL